MELLLFMFDGLSGENSSKNTFFFGPQAIRNAAETCNIFFRGFFGLKSTKMFATIGGSGDEQNFKKIYIFENYVTKLSFALGHGILHENRCFLGHPNVHIMYLWYLYKDLCK